jgi:hypothetical protein
MDLDLVLSYTREEVIFKKSDILFEHSRTGQFVFNQ